MKRFRTKNHCKPIAKPKSLEKCSKKSAINREKLKIFRNKSRFQLFGFYLHSGCVGSTLSFGCTVGCMVALSIGCILWLYTFNWSNFQLAAFIWLHFLSCILSKKNCIQLAEWRQSKPMPLNDQLKFLNENSSQI